MALKQFFLLAQNADGHEYTEPFRWQKPNVLVLTRHEYYEVKKPTEVEGSDSCLETPQRLTEDVRTFVAERHAAPGVFAAVVRPHGNGALSACSMRKVSSEARSRQCETNDKKVKYFFNASRIIIVERLRVEWIWHVFVLDFVLAFHRFAAEISTIGSGSIGGTRNIYYG